MGEIVCVWGVVLIDGMFIFCACEWVGVIVWGVCGCDCVGESGSVWGDCVGKGVCGWGTFD